MLSLKGVIQVKTTNFAKYVTKFFSEYLPGQKNVSKNTISTYKDSFRLLLIYCEDVKNIKPEKIYIRTIDKTLVEDYLNWLESNRNNSVATRNLRLATIHSFFRYIQKDVPEYLFEIQKILAIPYKKKPSQLIHYLSGDEMKILFSQPNLTQKSGRRNLVLMVVLYDTAARVQELADLKCKHVRISSPSVITLHGKGDKYRQVPIMDKSRHLLEEYIKESHYHTGISDGDMPLFYNQQHKKLSRWGISYILTKYAEKASLDDDFYVNFPITPHVIRHSKAMHLLQAGVNLIYIRDLLGHVDISTTELYARADMEMKRKALEDAYLDLHTDQMPEWTKDHNLMEWLSNLCD